MQQMFKLNDLNICIKKCQPHFEADTSNVFPGRWARLPVFYIICSFNKTRLRCSVSKCFPIFVLYRTNLLFKKQQIFSMCPEPSPQCYCRSTVILHSVSEINKAVIEKKMPSAYHVMLLLSLPYLAIIRPPHARCMG